jgi:hypothetical protein
MVRLTISFRLNWFMLLFVCVLSVHQLRSQEVKNLKLEDLPLHSPMKYYFRLENGDIISGQIFDYFIDKENGPAVRVQTEIGKATLYEYQISEILPLGSVNKHSHRSLLMPTAKPISDNHYAALYELIFPTIGIGITDYVSIIGMRSIIPGIFPNEQISLINGKITFLNAKLQSTSDNTLSMAFGLNSLWVNTINNINHVYFVTTYETYKLRMSALLMLKLGSPDVYQFTFSPYTAGSLFLNRNSPGAGITTDIKFNDTHDLYTIGELWMHSFQGGQNLNVLAGIRMADTRVSADLGFLFTTAPALIPIVAFTWTPF